MWRPNIKNRAFDRMGERYAHVIDPDHFLGRSAFDIPWRRKKGFPPVNLKKEKELFIIEMAVPGFEKDEIEILLDDDILTVRGEKSKSEKATKDEEFILEEFDFDSFERKFKLAASVAHEKITAKYDSGILRLTFIDVPEEEEKGFQTIKVE
jgi:HSP20 family protein